MMNMRLAGLALAGALVVGASGANAQQSDIFVLGAASDADASFGMASYTYTFGTGDRPDLGMTLGVAVRSLNYFNGVTDVSVDSQRVLLGYRFELGQNSVTSVQLGMENVSSTNQTGAILTLDHWSGLANGDSFFLLAELSEVNDQIYVSSNYMFAFDKFSVGPAISHVSLTGYSATDIGIQGNIQLSDNLTLIPNISHRISKAAANPTQTSVAASLGLFVRF